MSFAWKDINSLEIVAANVTACDGAAGPSLFPAARGFGGGEHRRGELFVQAEKMLHALAVARKGRYQETTTLSECKAHSRIDGAPRAGKVN